jgi:hypothetical protein
MVGKHPKRTPRPGVDRAGRTSLHYAAGEGAVTDVTRLLGSARTPTPRTTMVGRRFTLQRR